MGERGDWCTGGESGVKCVAVRAVARPCDDAWRLGEECWDDTLELETQGETDRVGDRAGKECSLEETLKREY